MLQFTSAFFPSPDFETSNMLTTNRQALHPLLPPTITSLGSTFYRVDVVDTMPVFMSFFNDLTIIRNAVGYATVVLRVTGQNVEKYYVLVSISCSVS